MEIQLIDRDFSVCKVAALDAVDFSDDYCFVGKTDEEISLVCSTSHAPMPALEREDGWKAFRIKGVLDFSLIGILSEISTLLAGNKIGIFAISTFNTDYILTKTENFEKAVRVLAEAGYKVTP